MESYTQSVSADLSSRPLRFDTRRRRGAFPLLPLLLFAFAAGGGTWGWLAGRDAAPIGVTPAKPPAVADGPTEPARPRPVKSAGPAQPSEEPAEKPFRETARKVAGDDLAKSEASADFTATLPKVRAMPAHAGQDAEASRIPAAPPRSPPDLAASTPPAPASNTPASNTADVSVVFRRAKALIAAGDLAAARLILTPAVNLGDGNAAFLSAETYDPAMLALWHVRGMRPNPAIAETLYRQALAAGVAEAGERLTKLRN